MHAVVGESELDDAVDGFLKEIGTAAPEAVREAKRMIREVAGRVEAEGDITTAAIAERRVSEEGQDGLTAFLQKRKPRWSAD